MRWLTPAVMGGAAEAKAAAAEWQVLYCLLIHLEGHLQGGRLQAAAPRPLLTGLEAIKRDSLACVGM